MTGAVTLNRLKGRRLDLLARPRCQLEFGDGKIVGMHEPGSEPGVHEVAYLAPGFVDLQINGAFGREVGVHDDALQRLSASLPAHGVTACVPTVVSSELSVYPRVDAQWRALREHTPGARLLGLHFEGPFLNPIRRGTHSETALEAIDPAKLASLLSCSGLGLLTLAPELPGAIAAIDAAVQAGVLVSLGHSEATWHEAQAAVDAGACSLTHLFNAMRGVDHRQPGLALLGLSEPRVCAGLIADGVHLHAEVLRLALRCLGRHRAYLVSDAMPAAGLGEGTRTAFAGTEVRVEQGRAVNREGRLAGSVALLDQALDHLIAALGLDWPQALALVTRNPARLWRQGGRQAHAALFGLGELVPGGMADVVGFDDHHRVCLTIVGGRVVYDRDGCFGEA